MLKKLLFYFNSILTLLLPKQCFGCSAFIEGFFCENCYFFIRPSFQVSTLFSNKHYFFVEYNSVVKDVFHYIKFSDQQILVAYLANLLSTVKLNNFDYDFWVPVPYHRKRLKKRGYHLIDQLFESFFIKHDIPKLDLLERIYYTDHLFDKSIEERESILAGVFSFKIEPYMIKQKKILVVDDIVTTGTTMNECLRLLSNMDVSKISVLSFAKVLIDHDKVT